MQHEEQQKKCKILLKTQLSTIKLCEGLLVEVMKKPVEIWNSFQKKALKIRARNQGRDCRWQIYVSADCQGTIWFDKWLWSAMELCRRWTVRL